MQKSQLTRIGLLVSTTLANPLYTFTLACSILTTQVEKLHVKACLQFQAANYNSYISPDHEGIGAVKCESFCHLSKSQAGKVFEFMSRPTDALQLPWKQWMISRVMGRKNNGGACSSSMENSALISVPASSLDQLPPASSSQPGLVGRSLQRSPVSGQLYS